MTKVILASSVAALLLLTGCSKKGPMVDESQNEQSQTEQAAPQEEIEVQTGVETEVVPEESVVVSDATKSADAVELSIDDMESKFSLSLIHI